MALFKIETVQGDSGILNWEICGWTVLALGMVILAIPVIRAIRRVINVCGDRTRTYSPNEEQSEDKKEQKTEGKYSAVVYTPSPAEHESKDPDSKPTNTMAKFQKKLDNEIDILYKESRNRD